MCLKRVCGGTIRRRDNRHHVSKLKREKEKKLANKIEAVRGMNDILPEQTGLWQYLENKLHQLAASYGYVEIRMPIVEKTELFKRSIGEVTDIVEKEMYTFLDRNEESLTLRPEGTACCVRAGIEHGLLYNQIQRFYYIGPMFRHERPQKGRYRQFYQFGVEAFGMAGPEIDAEIILMTARLWRELDLTAKLQLQINSLGSQEARVQYRQALVNYFSQYQTELDEDSKRRLQTNPLRILDSKNPAMQKLIAQAPQLMDYLDAESHQQFIQLQKILDKAGVRYQVNPRLVRGLDYYNRTVFEWVMGDMGAQNTVCAGGRYDGLVEQLGGQATPAVGFALGLERLVILLEEIQLKVRQEPDVYFIMAGAEAHLQGMALAEQLRNELTGLKLLCDCTGGNFKNQFKRADKSGARLALILGDDEIKNNKVAVKYLREHEGQQQILALAELKKFLAELFINRDVAQGHDAGKHNRSAE